MIILKHLTVERFRLLREVNLHFPQRGSILIQGPNEAGKSTLFECIYFALYGEPLASKRTARSLDDLILYGATTASVTLTLSVGAQELVITRSIERGQGQQVALQIRSLGMPDEPVINDLATANERIVSALNFLDGSALRNSSFIEQKGLSRLEVLNGVEREATLRKLLGLEPLIKIAQSYKLTDEDEHLLTNASEYLNLAEVQARIPELETGLRDAGDSLDALTITEDLTEISLQESEVAEQVRSIEQLQRKRHILKSRQQRLQQLKRADLILGEIIEAYDAIAEAQREIPDLDRQISELERRERKELPELEKRVQDLGDLTRSFGTLERMASDLLTSVNTLKELELEVREYEDFRGTLEALDEQIVSERQYIDQMTQAQHEVKDHHKQHQPAIAERMAHLKTISEHIKVLHDLEEQYAQDIMHQGLAEENSAQIKKVLKDIKETEQEFALVEKEAKSVQKQADDLEQRWRKLSIRRQLEDWERLKGLSDGLDDAEKHVRSAHEQQGQLSAQVEEANKHVIINGFLVVSFAVVAIICLIFAVAWLISGQIIGAAIFGLVALIAGAGVAWAIQRLFAARTLKQDADLAYSNGQNQVSMMVAAREAAVRMGGNHEALARAEQEIRALGGSVPGSVEEGRQMLEKIPKIGSDESMAELQQQMNDVRSKSLEARNQVNVTMEAVAALRKEWGRLDEQRRKEGWNEIESRLRNDKDKLTQAQKEIQTLASTEKLPVPNFDTSSSGILASSNEFESLIDAASIDAEREMANLNGRLEALPELVAQAKMHEDALDTLLVRKQVATERQEEFEARNPNKRLAQAREQQNALRDALRALQDSLRGRVKPLGVSFGQAAISSAEAEARRQLESLHITLGRRVELESRRSVYATTLQERQGSLSEYYKQLSKFSSSIGSWVVPLNPFAEALVGLRTRCQSEIQEASEQEIQREMESLRHQEGALNAKIALCNQEIEEARERITTMLAQRNLPGVKNFIREELGAVWSLVERFTPDDRPQLEDEHDRIEQELSDLQQREQELSARLQTRGEKLDLEEARARMTAQERDYQVKKHALPLVEALNQRMMQKMTPRTEHYIQQLLPLLTSGRYHDVKLQVEEQENLQMHVWESAANEYMPTSTFSGGTADQLSLTLRLAFAVAALPGDLTVAPGFLLLDEPLSAFDRDRTRALVDVITGDVLGQHFEQVLFISHSNTFDPAMFPYHVYMDNGSVVESNLPVVTAFPLPGVDGMLISSERESEDRLPDMPQTDPLPAIVPIEQ